MCGTFEELPSPLMGEGSGGGEDHTSSRHPNLPPLRGEGVLTYPCQPLDGGGKIRVMVSPVSRWPAWSDEAGRSTMDVTTTR
jgi:hypothetical protein